MYLQNFPNWVDAGINSDGHIASLREKVSGEISKGNSSIELEKIRALFSKYHLGLGLDMYENNILFQGDLEKYVDSAGIFLTHKENVECLLKLMEENNFPVTVVVRVKKLAERVLFLEGIKVSKTM